MLIDLGVSLFQIPFHSAMPAIHDGLTGSPGSFGKVLESILFLQENKAEICLVCVLTRQNIDLFHQTLETAKNLGIKRFMLARYNIGGRGIENAKNIIPSLSGLCSAFSIANDFVQNNGMRISANVCIPYCIIDPKDYPSIPISSCGSDLTRRPVTIDSFGNIRVCNHSPCIAGNIHSDKVSSIFETEYAKSWQTTHPGYCSECNQWTKCMGGCRAASEQLGRSLESEDPIIKYMNDNSGN
jgi:radical SAM protein with 4Fe4S-binding SPASM domain